MPPHLGAHPLEIPIPGHAHALGRPTCAGEWYRGGVISGEPASAQSERGERASDPAPLPCPLPCNNSTEKVAFPASAARTAHALQVNVEAAVGRWGLERTGFLTLTFADHVTDPAEAQRRMNSLATHVLRPRYGEAIRVYERQKSGRIHYHLLVNVGADIRTGFDFQSIKKHDYRSASAALRTEWAFWRRTAKDYGFGRTELLPVISTGEAVGRYVGKYIAKHLGVREERDLGVRLVSYIGPRVATVKFGWAGGKGRDWRMGLGALVRDLAAMGQIDGASVEAMRRQFGRRWAWEWRDIIAERARAMSDKDYVSTTDNVENSVPRGTNVQNCDVRLHTLEQCAMIGVDIVTGEIYGRQDGAGERVPFGGSVREAESGSGGGGSGSELHGDSGGARVHFEAGERGEVGETGAGARAWRHANVAVPVEHSDGRPPGQAGASRGSDCSGGEARAGEGGEA
jgi:hypothetical protein